MFGIDPRRQWLNSPSQKRIRIPLTITCSFNIYFILLLCLSIAITAQDTNPERPKTTRPTYDTPSKVSGGTSPSIDWAHQREPSYMPGPPTRGTVELIFTCLATYVLCIWTTLRPNIGPLSGTLSKITYSIFHAICPEFLLWTCYFEREVAGMLARELHVNWKKRLRNDEREEMQRSRRDNDDDEEDLRRKGKKEKAHRALGYYAMMGGYFLHGASIRRIIRALNESRPAGDASNATHKQRTRRGGYSEVYTSEPAVLGLCPDEKMLQGGGTKSKPIHSMLTIAGVLACSEMDILPALTIPSIKDRSKTDSLGNLVTCGQLLWMVGHVIARSVEGLPITLLELNTCAQCLVAIIMFFMWWDKPVDVQVPTIVVVPKGREKEFIRLMEVSLRMGVYGGGSRRLLVSEASFSFVGSNIADHVYHPVYTSSYFLTKNAILGSHLLTHLGAWDNRNRNYSINQRIYEIFGYGPWLVTLVCMTSVVWVAIHLLALVTRSFYLSIAMPDGTTIVMGLWLGVQGLNFAVIVGFFLYIAFMILFSKGKETDEYYEPKPLRANTNLMMDWRVVILSVLFVGVACTRFFTIVLCIQMIFGGLPKGSYKTVEWSNLIPHL